MQRYYVTCTCDDIGEGRCPTHGRENDLQDTLIEYRNAIQELDEAIKTSLARLLDTTKTQPSPRLTKPWEARVALERILVSSDNDLEGELNRFYKDFMDVD